MSNTNNSVVIDSNSIISSNESQESVELPLEIKETDKTSKCKNRKLHKAFIKGWTEDIAKNGFAHCIISSCNFISSDVLMMQKHYKNCNGVSLSGKNSCKDCGSFLPTSKELVCHKHLCRGPFKGRSHSTVTEERLKRWKHQIKTVGQAICGSQDCNFVAVKLADLEDHSRYCAGIQDLTCIHCLCEFSTKEDLSKHQEICSESISNAKKADNLHFRVIKQMKNKDSSEEHLIQPGPDLPKGQYRRRRAYRAEHKNSWALTLERFKYVKCIYQNCYFIAMSLEDMIAHFGYCNGDGSFAKFVCPYCNGRVTSEAILLKHIERSHSLENSSVKMEVNNEELLHSETQNAEGTAVEVNGSEKILEITMKEHSFSVKAWQDEITAVGYGFCRKSLCNFMAPSVSKLEAHWKTCDGTADFATFNCPKCRFRVGTKADLARHVAVCDDDKPKYFSNMEEDVLNFTENSQSEVMEDDFEIGPVFRQYQSKSPKIYSNQRKQDSATESEKPDPAEVEGNTSESQPNPKDTPKAKSRGRPRKSTGNTPNIQKEQVKCGKCDFKGSKSNFVAHNMRTHVGLGWMEGESPVDMNDEKLVIRLVKEAFRLNKKAACEKCNDVKRSVMGFVSHIQYCGKTEEERVALKVQCPYCEGKYLKYSLGSHIKLSHSAPVEEEEERSEILEEEEADPSGKRRSAIKAVSKLQQVLNENEEVETNQESNYILFEKGSEKLPKLNSKLNNLWYKLKREKKKIPCRHPNCKTVSDDVRNAKNHHYTCPCLPDKVYMCELCDFYSLDEPSVQSHVTTHRKYLKQKKTSGEDEIKDEEMKEQEEEEEEEDEDNEEDDIIEEEEQKSSEEEVDELDETRKRKKRRDEEKPTKKPKLSLDVKPNSDIGFQLKQSFCQRDNLQNHRGIQLYCNGLVMTLQEEMSAAKDTWAELHTTAQDWSRLSPEEAENHLPQLTTSVSVRFNGEKWRRFDRFGSDLIEGVPVMFTGGSVRSMSWCKTSFKRMIEKTQKQYLAVSTSKNLDHLKDVYERCSTEESRLFQIWDCGPLDNDLATNNPKFSMGIVQNGGEIWDLAWFPEDTYQEGGGGRMTRLGLLATASEDGAVRVWSVCDPDELGKGLPVYKTEPVVMLIADKDIEESCLKVSITSNGIIAGGFSNGTVAVWNLKNISSPFCKKSGKSRLIRAHLVFHAHKAGITALTFCPVNNRYISTAGLDRFVKVWDLEFPSVPVEQHNKEYSLDNIWTLNWPSLIYNFDDVVLSFNKGTVKFIRNILTDKHQSTINMSDACLSLSFSDWLNALCGGSTSGEVKFRLLKNLIQDQKKSQNTVSLVSLEELSGGNAETQKEGRQVPTSYDEVESRFGLVFRDNLGLDKGKSKKCEIHPEEFPIRAVNKVAFNPNFKSFTHIAVGYNCGLVRIHPLRELQSVRGLKFLLEKVQEENFNI